MAPSMASVKGRAEREYETFKQSIVIFFNHLKKRNALEVMSLVDVPAWWALRNKHIDLFKEAVDALKPDELSKEELAELRYAYRFARASYGEQMLKGYMNDAANFIYMEATTGGCAFTNEDDCANARAMLQMLGLEEKHVVQACMHGETLCPAHACLLDHENRRAVICIRGTLTMEDALTNTAADAVEYADFLGGTVHQGMLQSAEWLLNDVQEKMIKAAVSHPKYDLIVSGHSLGAGAAAVVTLLLDTATEQRPRCFGFASVKGVGFATPGIVSKSIASNEEMKKIFTTVVYNRDIIPRLCVPKLDFMCYEVARENTVSKAKKLFSSWMAGISDKADKAESYCERKELKKQETGSVEGMEDEPHFPLGRCVFYAQPEDGPLQCKQFESVQCDKIFFNELMFNDHILFNYGVAIGAEGAPAAANEHEDSTVIRPKSAFCCF